MTYTYIKIRSSDLNNKRREIIEKEKLIIMIMSQYKEKTISIFEFVKKIGS